VRKLQKAKDFWNVLSCDGDEDDMSLTETFSRSTVSVVVIVVVVDVVLQRNDRPLDSD
jgi:hypothetical protein